MSVKEGDRFYYAPWGGECAATFTSNGSLKVYAKSRGPNTAAFSWECQGETMVQNLLCGEYVNIVWDGNIHYPMKVKDSNTFEVFHQGGKKYEFKRM